VCVCARDLGVIGSTNSEPDVNTDAATDTAADTAAND
jgi:hypothetical protein